MNVLPKREHISEYDRRVAIHEAGHAIATLDSKRPLYKVTTVASKKYSGFILHKAVKQKNADTHDVRTEIVISLAGLVAEFIKFGSKDGLPSADEDLWDALRWIRFAKYNKTLNEYLALTKEILTKRWTDVENLADVLLDEKTLSARDVRQVLKNGSKIKTKPRMKTKRGKK